MLIHKPSFMAALSQNRVASHLILAMCAMSAPFCQSPQVKSQPPRLAGIKFYEDALNILFDSSGRLICEPNLQTVQSLCLLEMHDVVAQYSWTKCYRYLGMCFFPKLRGMLYDNPGSRHRYQNSFRDPGHCITGEPPFVAEADHPGDGPNDRPGMCEEMLLDRLLSPCPQHRVHEERQAVQRGEYAHAAPCRRNKFRARDPIPDPW